MFQVSVGAAAFAAYIVQTGAICAGTVRIGLCTSLRDGVCFYPLRSAFAGMRGWEHEATRFTLKGVDCHGVGECVSVGLVVGGPNCAR